MTFLPVLERELGIRARARATYRLRVAIALFALLISVPQLTGILPAPAAAGKWAFEGTITAGFLLSCCACLLTCDSISAERRDGTLGLLVLTRVKSLDVVAGKLGSVGVSSFCALVAFTPVLMLPLLAGGVTGGEAWRNALALFDTLFLSLAVGLHASARHESFSRSARGAVVTMLLLILVPLWFWEFTRTIRWLGWLSPMVPLLCANDWPYTRGLAGHFWAALLIVQALGWILLLNATRRLRGSLQEPARPIRTAARELSNIPAEPASDWRGRRGDMQPVEWLVLQQRGIRASLWGAAICIHLNQSMWVLFGRFIPSPGLYYVPTYVLALLSGALIAWCASRFLAEARRTGLLELLLTTPVGASTLFSGQAKALKRLLLWPLLVMLSPALFRLLFVLLPFGGLTLRPTGFNLFTILLSLANLTCSVLALCSLGVLLAFCTRTQARAILWTVGLGTGLPYLLSFLCYAVVFPLARRYGTSVYFAYALVPLAELAWFLWLIAAARRHLAREARAGTPEFSSVRDVLFGPIDDMKPAIQKARRWPSLCVLLISALNILR